MPWTTTHDPDAFLAAAGAFLRADPVRHTVLLTVPASLLASGGAFRDGAPLLGWLDEGGDGTVSAAFLHTPPYPLLLSDAPADALAALAADLVALGRRPPGVNATRAAATAFARAWGGAQSDGMRSRLYRLATLTPPRPAPAGAARVATAADRDLLVDYYERFAREADVPATGADRFVDGRLAFGGMLVWEDGAGAPVAMAGMTRPAAGMVRVAPVYTAPDQRRRGYGGAVTAAMSERALQAGAHEVLIFADLANPTTPALYPSIGYEPVEDRVIINFCA